MKKYLLIILAALTLGGCSDDTASTVKKSNCNCGLILDDRVYDYSILVRNDCTGNEIWIQLYPGDWVNAHPGERACFTDRDSW